MLVLIKNKKEWSHYRLMILSKAPGFPLIENLGPSEYPVYVYANYKLEGGNFKINYVYFTKRHAKRLLGV